MQYLLVSLYIYVDQTQPNPSSAIILTPTLRGGRGRSGGSVAIFPKKNGWPKGRPGPIRQRCCARTCTRWCCPQGLSNMKVTYDSFSYPVQGRRDSKCMISCICYLTIPSIITLRNISYLFPFALLSFAPHATTRPATRTSRRWNRGGAFRAADIR